MKPNKKIKNLPLHHIDTMNSMRYNDTMNTKCPDPTEATTRPIGECETLRPHRGNYGLTAPRQPLSIYARAKIKLTPPRQSLFVKCFNPTEAISQLKVNAKVLHEFSINPTDVNCFKFQSLYRI